MNILLVGEYSRLHNSLKEGLQKLGHQVVIVGFKDGFKDFPVDFPLTLQWDSGLLKKLKLGIYKLTGFDVTSYLTYRQFKRHQQHLKGFDVVQLINENTFYCSYVYEKKILQFLFDNNKKAYLLCCGTDYLTVNYYFENPTFKSLLLPYLDGKIPRKEFQSVLKFRTSAYKKLHQFIYDRIEGIIASDIDYHIPLQGNPKYLGMVPNPVNIEKLPYIPMTIDSKIVIFHGINTLSYFRKGNDYFEKALEIISKKYQDRVEIVTTRSIPYEQYIEIYNRTHLLLDMVYSFDQGYHALEAMAKGKVVFTGAEKEFSDYYVLTEAVNINAKPDVADLVEKLSFLIENPDEILAISKRARTFIEKEHHYIDKAKQYVDLWQSSSFSIGG